MDYRKIIEDLVDVDTPADEELRYAAAVSIRELLEKKLELARELHDIKRCLTTYRNIADRFVAEYSLYEEVGKDEN